MAELGHKFIYDLLSELRKSPRRKAAVVDALNRVDRIRRNVADGKASHEDVTEAQADLVPLCGFNFGLLIPAVFPNYPFDTPLDFASRPFMFAMTSLTPNSVITLKAGRQVGKCADGETEVITEKGPRTLKSIFDEGIPV